MGRAAVLTRRVAERAALAIGLVAFFVAGYFGIGRTVDPARALDLATSLDGRIPFVAGSVWVYLALFPAATLPVFVVRCPRLFRRTVLAYALAIAVSLILFATLPVTSIGLRASLAALDPERLSPWAVSLLYRLDPPFNSFPSLHLAIAALAASSLWKASRAYGVAAFAGVSAIGLSICTVKQHFVLDGVAGLALAGLVYAAVLQPYEPEDALGGTSPSRSRNVIR